MEAFIVRIVNLLVQMSAQCRIIMSVSFVVFLSYAFMAGKNLGKTALVMTNKYF